MNALIKQLFGRGFKARRHRQAFGYKRRKIPKNARFRSSSITQLRKTEKHLMKIKNLWKKRIRLNEEIKLATAFQPHFFHADEILVTVTANGERPTREVTLRASNR